MSNRCYNVGKRKLRDFGAQKENIIQLKQICSTSTGDEPERNEILHIHWNKCNNIEFVYGKLLFVIQGMFTLFTYKYMCTHIKQDLSSITDILDI